MKEDFLSTRANQALLPTIIKRDQKNMSEMLKGKYLRLNRSIKVYCVGKCNPEFEKSNIFETN